ncbi:hypothetical protein [Actinomadura parmotrematis]|uniref:Uncharacterized protein n=1 Tax=Actinomadura parmotrematis TaxID=2864039 RepID=A0ABS7FNB0_9ACTN|nr:hypothetical protein [Actinomadura parmotrematis]MBW8481043.1 hypothetical protein [Actinomadura parmotrematis]
MWLNLIILGAASLVVGFVLGWIVACPRRWDTRYLDEPAGDLPPMPRVADRV